MEILSSNGHVQQNPKAARKSESHCSNSAFPAANGKLSNGASSNGAATNGGMATSKSENDNRLRLNSTSSPGSTSGRSSTSSLNTVGLQLRNGAPKHKEPRKVSIMEQPAPPSPRPSSSKDPTLKQAASTSNINNSTFPAPNLSSASSRTSLLHISSEKRARKVRFFINNDKFFKGATIAISGEKFRAFGKLLEHLTRIMCNQVTLPNGVRFVFGLDGGAVEDVAQLSHEGNYVCSSHTGFKKLDYLRLAQDNDQMQWNRIRRETYYLGGTVVGGKIGLLRRETFKQSGHAKSFGQAIKSGGQVGAHGDVPPFKPKIIAVLRSGLRPRRAIRVLLNHRNAKSFDTVLADLTNLVKLDTGAVRKVFTLDGKAVLAVSDFGDAEVFLAYGVDKTQTEDFDLDAIEFRNVQAILKSPELDSKYEQFATSSPKSNRKKFTASRLPEKSGKHQSRKFSASKNRDSPRYHSQSSPSSGYGNGDSVVSATSAVAPAEITERYLVGDIIGDGNFAVVRKCFSKKTKLEYALKVIDKSKCQGKEHMIESEVSILNLVSHPNIIELVEVFDLPDEKYLVTEYVRGGDLFDAIAVDTKYTELVARGMVRDLTAALKYLHDKMIVHRDIKPENLLVVDYPGQGLKSLKLGDFGLAQVVSEPLFTVCGTPTYVAPEILAETGYGVKVDVWATGVIMYILLVGFPPFSSRTNNQEELFDQILSGLFEFNSPDWDDISYPAKELISWMLQVDPLQRYSAYEILQHPWIKNTEK